MDNDLKELTRVLGREQELFGRYLELLTEQQEYLVENDLDGVRATVEKINVLSQDAADLENGRRRLLERISKAAHLRPEDVNITRLLEKLGGPIFQEFVRLKDTLVGIQEKITEQRIRNELLIDQSMRMISHSMQLIHKTGNPKATYDNPSHIKGVGGAQGSLISRMV